MTRLDGSGSSGDGTATDGDGGGGDLRVDPEQLVSAAGGFEALAAELGSRKVTVLNDGVVTGNDTLDGALHEFGASWTDGLTTILNAQAGIAAGLRKTVSEYIESDLEVAYVMQYQLQKLADG